MTFSRLEKNGRTLGTGFQPRLQRIVIANSIRSNNGEFLLNMARNCAEIETEWKFIRKYLMRTAPVAPPFLEISVAKTRAASSSKAIYYAAINDRSANKDFGSYIRIVSAAAPLHETLDVSDLQRHATFSVLLVEVCDRPGVTFLPSSDAAYGKIQCGVTEFCDVVIDILLDQCLANSSPIKEALSRSQLNVEQLYKRKVDFVLASGRTSEMHASATYTTFARVARNHAGGSVAAYVDTSIAIWLDFCAAVDNAASKPSDDLLRVKVMSDAINAFPSSRRGQIGKARLMRQATSLKRGPYYLCRIAHKPKLEAQRSTICTAFAITKFRVGLVRILSPDQFNQLTQSEANSQIEFVKMVIP